MGRMAGGRKRAGHTDDHNAPPARQVRQLYSSWVTAHLADECGVGQAVTFTNGHGFVLSSGFYWIGSVDIDAALANARQL